MLGLVDAILTFDPALADQLTDKADLSSLGTVVAITGSGKETFKTFNVSTAAALVASCHPGICVVKPAGRATSAITGASDVLEALGVRLPATTDQAVAIAHRTGVCIFDYHLVAPRYGPRYEGRFHQLHPLSHVTPWMFVPINLDGLVFGVADHRSELSASVIARTGPPTAAVVTTDLGAHGRIDEMAPFGTASITWVKDRSGHTTVTRGTLPRNLAEIAQRDGHAAGAALIRHLLDHATPGLAYQLVCANAALLLQAAGVPAAKATDLCEQYLINGDARRKLDHLIASTWEDE